jgi:hypothetical protein
LLIGRAERGLDDFGIVSGDCVSGLIALLETAF